MEDAKQLALTVCVSGDCKSYVKRNAIEYLNAVFGSEVIFSEILPSVNEEFLTVIGDLLYKESDARLEKPMIKQLKTKQNLHLLKLLICMNSKFAVEYYTKAVSCKNGTFHQNSAIYDPTEAISTIKNPELLPELIQLAKVRFRPGCEDENFHCLYSSLINALSNCAKTEFNRVRSELVHLKESASDNQELIGFCSNTINAIDKQNASCIVRNWTLAEVKAVIQGIT